MTKFTDADFERVDNMRLIAEERVEELLQERDEARKLSQQFYKDVKEAERKVVELEKEIEHLREEVDYWREGGN